MRMVSRVIPSTLTLVFLALIQPVVSFGRIGHWLSGRIADDFLVPDAKTFVRNLIPEQQGRLGNIANWADSIKSNHSYDWASALHYINPKTDNPPTSCTYRPGPEDCPGRICVVAAIHNYTSRLCRHQEFMPESLKFLVHFIGDLHQPLHATGKARGGTLARARFQGRSTTLHAIWDYMMFDKRIRDDFHNNREQYANYLVQKIKTDWRGEVSSWTSCPVKWSSLSSSFEWYEIDQMLSVCPETWATASNRANCEVVWQGYQRKYELSGRYYQLGIPVAEKLLAQAAFRIAYLINTIALTCPPQQEEMDAPTQDMTFFLQDVPY